MVTTIYQTTSIDYGSENRTQAKITVYFTGVANTNVWFYITADNGGTWDAISAAMIGKNGVEITHNFAVAGNNVKFKIVGTTGTTVVASQKLNGEFTAPAIKIQVI